MTKLTELLKDGVTVEDVMNSTLDGLTFSKVFSIKNSSNVEVGGCTVNYLGDGTTFKAFADDAIRTNVIATQRVSRALSEKELKDLFHGNGATILLADAGKKIESMEERASKAVAAAAGLEGDALEATYVWTKERWYWKDAHEEKWFKGSLKD